MTIELTDSEAALIVEVLGKVTVPASDPEGERICRDVRSILKKIEATKPKPKEKSRPK